MDTSDADNVDPNGRLEVGRPSANDVDREHVFFNEGALSQRAEHERARSEIERRQQARAIALPTSESDVIAALRARGQPATLFGEDAHDRRERLRSLLADFGVANVVAESVQTQPPTPQAITPEPEEFFTEGSQDLRASRRDLLRPSLTNARQRLLLSRQRQRSPQWREAANALSTRLQQSSPLGSQIGDERPLSACAFARQDSNVLATSSWSGVVKVWDAQNFSTRRTLLGHTQRVSALEFHPHETTVLASGSADNDVRLWRLSEPHNEKDLTSLRLSGHIDRVSGVAFHPNGKLLASASFDSSWRLWDVKTAKELLLQEGHSKAVYRVAFHPDGSLLASGGYDRAVCVWDLRSGRRVLRFAGHVAEVTGVDFNADGYQLATSSADNSIRVWDLRRRKAAHVIAAHSSVVSQAKFQPESGHVLVSSSFDRTVKVWSRRGYVLVATLTGHEEKVTGVDISVHGDSILSCCYDKTWRLWKSGGLAQPLNST